MNRNFTRSRCESGFRPGGPRGLCGLCGLLLAALTFPAAAQTPGTATVTAAVTVSSSGQMAVSPTTMTASSAAQPLQWTLGPGNYAFGANPIAIDPGAGDYTCNLSQNDTVVTCTAGAYNKGDYPYTINLVPKGTAKPPIPPSHAILIHNG